MNLKDSMTYLENLKKAYSIYKDMLLDDDNIYNKVEYHFKKEAHPKEVNIIYNYKSPISNIISIDESEKGQRIVDVIINRMVLLIDEIEIVEGAIARFSKELDISVDDLKTMIATRKQIKKIYISLNRIKGHEYKYYDQDYIFNQNNDHIKYKYPVRVIKTIDFDRKKVRKLIKKSDYVIGMESKSYNKYLKDIELDFIPTLEDKVQYYLVDGAFKK